MTEKEANKEVIRYSNNSTYSIQPICLILCSEKYLPLLLVNAFRYDSFRFYIVKKRLEGVKFKSWTSWWEDYYMKIWRGGKKKV